MTDPLRLLVVQNDPTDPVALLGEWWAEVGVETTAIRADLGEPVPTEMPDGYDGLVLLGGAMAAWEDDVAPWLPAERELIRGSVGDGVPTMGVCLGGQLMTLALGGEVTRADIAEIGLVPLSLADDAADDPLLSVVPEGAPVGQYHIDTMATLPEGAVLLASSPDCAHQAWRLGDRAWAVQFHPEIDTAIMQEWIDEDRELVHERGFDCDTVVDDFAARMDELRTVWRPFAHAFADVVRQSAAR
ncbi:MAG TPA: type 1 glutamine amidotransferase [Candidatus Nanopelagicales bacterium]|nr:type 1 glutamine amidotransferase [Candidatus Nanopelagicales bacterium]